MGENGVHSFLNSKRDSHAAYVYVRNKDMLKCGSFYHKSLSQNFATKVLIVKWINNLSSLSSFYNLYIISVWAIVYQSS